MTRKAEIEEDGTVLKAVREAEALHCAVCGYVWQPRLTRLEGERKLPVRCPSCLNRKWQGQESGKKENQNEITRDTPRAYRR